MLRLRMTSLRLAHPAEATQHVSLLALALVLYRLWQQYTSELCWSVWDAVKTKYRLVFTKVRECFSYTLWTARTIFIQTKTLKLSAHACICSDVIFELR